jgi:hypothetical protein
MHQQLCANTDTMFANMCISTYWPGKKPLGTGIKSSRKNNAQQQGLAHMQ